MVIYGLIDPRTDVLRYVGKAVNVCDRLRNHVAEAREPGRKCRRVNWLRSLAKLGLKPELVELEMVEGDGSDAERFWVASIRATGAFLLNMTDGGEGAAWTPSMKAAASASRKGKPKSDATRAAMSASKTPELRAKVGSFHLGRKRSAETKAKMSAAQRKPRTEAQKASLRKAWEANGIGV